MDNNSEKYALYCQNWDFQNDDIQHLKSNAKTITLDGYSSDMKGHIFCPVCCVSLDRCPQNKDVDSAGRKAFFRHSRKHRRDCYLRTQTRQGIKFSSKEEAVSAIENGELVIVKGFLEVKPEIDEPNSSSIQSGRTHEDQKGDTIDVPISRHKGKTFKLPSVITTVQGICRNFRENLHKHYFFPSIGVARPLADLLVDIRTVTKVDNTPKLYYGLIESSYSHEHPTSIRSTKLDYKRSATVEDFHLKLENKECQEHGINESCNNRIVLMYGMVTKSGTGLCIEKLNWGEYGLLPEKYNDLLPTEPETTSD